MNFEENITRRVSLWIDNERGFHETVHNWANELLENPPQSEYVDQRNKIVYELSERVEEFFTRHWTQSGDLSSPQEEFMRTALAYVNWDEIAEGYISQVEEERT